jgi:hypothetical protein
MVVHDFFTKKILQRQKKLDACPTGSHVVSQRTVGARVDLGAEN